MQTRQCFIVFGLGALATIGTLRGAGPAIDIDPPRRGFTIRTERLDAVFRDGAIVHLRNRLTGEILADEQLAETRMPTGLGHLSGNIQAMSAIHHPWGNLRPMQREPEARMVNYHRPCDASSFVCKRTRRGVRAEWTGLTNDLCFFPGETLRIEAETDDAGALVFRASATSPTGGVFGVTVPLVNLLPGARFHFPSFGGMRFTAGGNPVLKTFGQAPFFEAPVMAAEIGRGSLALWKEDTQFHSYFTFFNWTGKSFGFAFEHLNLMPFEPHSRVDSADWKLDVTDGGWMQALAPYKKWYAGHFARELKVRDAVAWADRIGVVIDAFNANREVLDRVASLFPPESVLMHEWNARAPAFGVDLPDWTPREGYIDKVRLMHEYGFKTMAYVCTYCAVYNSPVWKRDNLGEQFLTRKYSLSNYGRASEDREMDSLIGDVQGAASADQFAGMKDGRFLYGDPLHPGWRRYHSEQMAWWNSTTGTDANYEDTAGCAGDFGNGVVDGKSGAQGSVAMMRELLGRQPGVPMASEYGPDAIAFAVKWPLVYAQVWGGDAFRAHRKHAQVPVNAYLFGYRTWIPVINAGTDFLKHVVAACSDAAGGMGMTSAAPEALDCRAGFTGHMVWRAQVFARRGLAPYFDPAVREPDLVCMYRDREGGLYRYRDDGRLQRLTGPDGHDLYARAEKTNRLDTALSIPGWPAVTGHTLFGLDPGQRYALFPPADGTRPPVRLDTLPDGIVVRMSRHDRDYALLVLDRAAPKAGPAQAAVPFTLDRSFETVCVNGTNRPLAAGAVKATLDLTFPARILFASAGPAPAFNEQLKLDFNRLKIRKVSPATGLQEMVLTNNLPVLRRTINTGGMAKPRTAIALWGSGWENTLDFLVRVPSRTAAVRVYAKASTTPYGDGTIAKLYINGACVRSLDNRRANPDWKQGMPKSEKTLIDSAVHEWIVPVGQYAGHAVLVTIASDPKRDGNADQQWMSIPELIEDEAQQASAREMK